LSAAKSGFRVKAESLFPGFAELVIGPAASGGSIARAPMMTTLRLSTKSNWRSLDEREIKENASL
jgi:hypothetical protein